MDPTAAADLLDAWNDCTATAAALVEIDLPGSFWLRYVEPWSGPRLPRRGVLIVSPVTELALTE